MKRLIVVLSGLLVLPAFAEVAPAYYYDDVIEYSDTDIDSDVDDVVIADDADVAQDTGKTSVPTVASRTVANTNSRAAAASPRHVQRQRRVQMFRVQTYHAQRQHRRRIKMFLHVAQCQIQLRRAHQSCKLIQSTHRYTPDVLVCAVNL